LLLFIILFVNEIFQALKNSFGFYCLTYYVLPVVYLFIKKIIRYKRNIKMKAFRKSKENKFKCLKDPYSLEKHLTEILLDM